jgi:hypothetical protein
MNIKNIAEYVALGAASIGANVLTGTKNVIETVSSGQILPTIDITTTTVPEPAEISNVFNLITQLTILIVTLWKALKKPKPTKTPTETI